MAKRTAADQFVEILQAAGVRRMYGVVGDSLNPVVDAVRRHDGIDWVHMRHEEAGAFAAGAEAQLTGRLVACAGSCGPGNLHLINGLYDAHRSMAPVLALAAQIPSTEIGTGYFQETQPTLTFQGIQYDNPYDVRTAPSWIRCWVATASWCRGCGRMPRRCAGTGRSTPSTSPPPLMSWPPPGPRSRPTGPGAGWCCPATPTKW